MSWVNTYASTATVNAITTIHTAHLSAVRTILERPAFASSMILDMRARVESSPMLSTTMSMEPYMLVAPEQTLSPGAMSTGTDSPVSMELSMVVVPLSTVPSTGTISPGTILTRSPTDTLSTGTTDSVPSSEMRLAVSGLMEMSLRTSALAWLTVASSRKAPICMIMAISAAASYSPMRIDATMATETRTSAVMSCSLTTPTMAP